MANGIQARNQIAEGLSLAADEAKDAALRQRLRALTRTVLSDRLAETSETVDRELIELSGELAIWVRQGQTAVAEKEIERIEALLPRRAVPVQGGKKMGLFKKISEKLGGKPKVSAADAARDQADSQLFELEKQIALLSEKRKREVEKLRQFVEQAVPLDSESFEYQQLRGRAGIVKKQIALYEDQINTYFRALMDNQRYAQLIDNGQAMQGLSSLLPDPAEADVLLEQLSQQVEDVRDRQDAFSDTVRAYDARMTAGVRVSAPEDDAFDRAVAAARGEAEKSDETVVQDDPVANVTVGDASDDQPRVLSDAQEI